MATDKVENYAKRIARVIGFAEASIEEGKIPSLSQMADVAALSEYHFHRVFRLMTGETPADAISRIRLAAALGRLEAGDMAAAVAASGYATHQAFARALKDRLGVSPGKLSADQELLALCKSRLSTPDMNFLSQTPITVEVAELNPLRVLARRNVGDFADLNIGFGLLFEAISAQLDPGLIRGIYGMPLDDPRFVAAEQCRFDSAFDVGNAGHASGSMVELEIAGGRYGGLHHLGDYDAIHEKIDGLYVWAIESGEEIASRPLFIHYLDDPEEVPPAAQRAVVWLPLKETGS